ncbi:MAG: Glutaredoxin-like protein, YruB-family [archaeon GW2011_AR13]|nr:MAG: Glutaredoxin-like protein, YruB-family [archaeon GW2011_AR13]HIG95054.1 NrdH-redoxin [Nanoarchaeota archaeon]HIH62760.1 NrdH-redoxin [Nanoarchaeota archaeon]HIJ09998.1 NrdH-redoxin [Nanoarchaeota archaeon]
MKIIIYSTPTCPSCKNVKEFLKEKKIKFITKDVSIKKNADEMIKKSNQMSVPVIDINGKIIIGFEKDKLNRQLK